MSPTIEQDIEQALQHYCAGRLAQAEAMYREVLRREPGHGRAMCLLGRVLQQQGRADEAAENYRAAFAVDHEMAEACAGLGDVLAQQGQLDEALRWLGEVVRLRPGDAAAGSNHLHILQYDPKTDQATLLNEYRRWAQRHAEPLYAEIRPHSNDRAPERRLRIGYVSPDLRLHVVGRLIEPLLTRHDRRAFHITCYSDTPYPDGLTAWLRSHAELWRDTRRLTDAQLSQQVRDDGIDILVDLSQHTGDNRLLVFARKPAPVQVSYLGSNSMTGLRTIDYCLTDRLMSPSAEGSGFRVQGSERDPYSLNPNGRTLNPDEPETLWPLLDTYWCYTAPTVAPEVNALPAIQKGIVTFASLNKPAKIHDQIITLWSDLLRAVQQSRLLLTAPAGRNTHVLQSFEKHGIDPARIALAAGRSFEKYWELYHEADIALDPFPFNGGVTTLDALYMGVPVVTLAGDTPLSRGGVSILTNLKLTELIAPTPRQYVEIAAALAADLPRLARSRQTLRSRLRKSPLMDGPRFAKAVEAAYREMWRRWCQR